jgi:Dyp-type peroxidase family
MGIMTMETLNLRDVQGIIVYGYGKLAAACFILLQVTDADAAKPWLGRLANRITNAEANPSQVVQETCLNIAFTRDGLEALGLDRQTLETFANEFQEGITGTEHRQRILGDQGESAPEFWRWGGPTPPPVHILLMLYAIDEATLNSFYELQAQDFASSGIAQIDKLETYRLPKRGEHFGFRDDIADPIIADTNRQGTPENTINAGEFILGYANGYGQYTNSPAVNAEQDPGNFLAPALNRSELRDFGRNGSYLVFRQLSQDVRLFWQFLDEATRSDGSSNPEARLKLAAKMVGRWPSGAPLAISPQQDSPELAEKNDFLYHDIDAEGFKCPFGAHIRRMNPRDSLQPDSGSKESLDRVNRHRILRRGRSYGRPLAASMHPDEILAAADSEEERGLHFICFNANISRQFEFIQHTWVNNPKFNGLYDEDDPLIGDRNPGQDVRDSSSDRFTVQAAPVRQRVRGLPRFVQVRGGAYFFMPSINAVRFLASLS